ncbi:GNAT family N-acetyltransferase [Mycolicibacterium septicum]|nr:GNAT family N-acetyltransferase [Mycolicibacterium septicum]
MDAKRVLGLAHVKLDDGADVAIRTLQPDDTDRVVRLYQSLTDDECYFRFFTLHPAHLQNWARSLTDPSPGQYAIGAFESDGLLGVANYINCDLPGYAEVAVVVAHNEHLRGVGTALLQFLGEKAVHTGIHHFVADILAENHLILRVLADCGWPCRRHLNGSVIHLEIDLNDVV